MFRLNSGLTALQLTETLTQDLVVRSQFKGVWAADMIPDRKLPGLYIFNTATSRERGRHWVTVYVPRRGQSEFFDSLAHSPGYYQLDFEKFLLKHQPSYMINNNTLQDYGTVTCGYYEIFFAVHRCHGWKMVDILQLFTRDLNKNDIRVVNFMHEYFSSSNGTNNTISSRV